MLFADGVVDQGAQRLFELGVLGVIVAGFLGLGGFMIWYAYRRFVGSGKDDPGLLGWMIGRFDSFLTKLEDANQNNATIATRLTNLLESHAERCTFHDTTTTLQLDEIIGRLKRQDIAGAAAARMFKDYLQSAHPNEFPAIAADCQRIISELEAEPHNGTHHVST